MAKTNEKDLRNKANAEGSRSLGVQSAGLYGGTGSNPFGPGGLTNAYTDAQNKSNESYNKTQGAYTDIMAQKDGGFNPTQLDGLRNNVSGIVNTGGFDQSQVDSLRSGYNKALPTGGFDPTQLDYLRSQGKSFADTGGYDPATLDKIRSGYGAFADTGGFTPEQEQAFRTRSTRPVEATYGVLDAQQQRDRAATGGLGTGGQTALMARQLSEQASKAATGAEVGLAEQERAGKLAGLGGLQTTESDLSSRKGQALTTMSGLESDVASGGRAIMGQQQGLETSIAGNKTKGVDMQSNLESTVATQNMQAIAGEKGLYDSASGQMTQTGTQILQLFGLTNASQSEQLSMLAQVAQTPGLFDNIMKGIQVGAGAISGVGTGLGALSGPAKAGKG